MNVAELSELLELTGWSRTRLAAELEITSGAIDKWYQAGQTPGGPVAILLSDWLVRARNAEPLRASAKQRPQRNGRQPVHA